MQDPKELITTSLRQWQEKNSLSGEFDVEIIQNQKFGDFATNIAMVSKGIEGGQNPRQLAEKIVEELKDVEDLKEIIEKIEVAGPGFINFYLSNHYLSQKLHEIISASQRQEDASRDGQLDIMYGNSTKKEGQKIMVEFTDPNPLKEFHIGHLYSNAVGESISRLLESQGAEVKRACYQGDVGLHVAKAIAGIQTLLDESVKTIDELDTEFNDTVVGSEYGLDTQARRAQFLGQAYARGSQLFEIESNKAIIHDLNKKVYTREDSSINKLYDIGKRWSLEYFDTIYKRLGTKFDYNYFESEVGVTGLEIVKKHIGEVFEESEGAIIFSEEKSGLHTRVFINSLGLPTYEAKELGLAPKKYNDFQYDQSIVITGNEINEYFKVLLKALSMIEPELADKTQHLSHGMVRLPEGKMSSRTGNVITGMYLLNDAQVKIMDRMSNNELGLQQQELLNIVEKITVGSVKYSFLKVSLGRDFEYSFNETVSFEGNSSPYIQYTYVRTLGVLHKAKAMGIGASNELVDIESQGADLLRFILQFPSQVEIAANNFAPNILCNYLFELSQKFNLFYQQNKIVKTEEDYNASFNLSLTQAVGNVLKNGLSLLGIQTVEKM